MVKPYSPLPVLTEDSGGYTTKWFCLPPPEHFPFQVNAQRWLAGERVREIYSWKLAYDRTECDGYMLRIVPSWGS